MEIENAEYWLRISDWILTTASYHADPVADAYRNESPVVDLLDGATMESEESPLKRRRINVNNMDLPNIPFPLYSQPSRSTSSRRSKSSASGRIANLTKRTQSLLSLEKPVHYIAIQENPSTQLPDDILPLYNKIYESTVENRAFLPHHIRDELCSITGRSIMSSWFTEEKEEAEKDVGQLKSNALRELDSLTKIKCAAKESLNLGRSESAWNLKVHDPLLELALTPYSDINQELITSAQITSPYRPRRTNNTDAKSKLVDFALLLVSENAAIQKALSSLPIDMQFVNQTAYLPLQYSPIAISIETKTTGSAEEGRVQLGIWTAAWHRRMREFLQQKGNTSTIVTLPLLLIVEHDWKLYFACDRGHCLEIIGEMPIGNTRSILGLYSILAVIRQLAEWIESTFKTWITGALSLGVPS